MAMTDDSLIFPRHERIRGVYAGAPPDFDPFDPPPDAVEEPEPSPPRRRFRAALAFLLLLLAWLAIAAPVSRTALPLGPPPIVLTAADGTPIARMGAIMDRPVKVAELPPHVTEAFLAIEDRRFRDHWGIDPFGIGRARAPGRRRGRDLPQRPPDRGRPGVRRGGERRAGRAAGRGRREHHELLLDRRR